MATETDSVVKNSNPSSSDSFDSSLMNSTNGNNNNSSSDYNVTPDVSDYDNESGGQGVDPDSDTFANHLNDLDAPADYSTDQSGKTAGFSTGGKAVQESLYSSPFVNSNIGDEILRLATNQARVGAGHGNYDERYSNALSQYDWYRAGSTQITNHEVQGLVFITRPVLNFHDSSLGQDSKMSMLKMARPDSFGFSIRSYLDPRFANYPGVLPHSTNNPLYNHESPFLIPLQNSLSHISGWPSFDLHTEASEAGYMSESQTISRGSDFNYQAVDLTLGFQDIQGGYIMAMFEYWTRAIALMNQGVMQPYIEDIIEDRLCYTCSIYRFVLDHTKTKITKWAKATGCFPTSVPIGPCFDIEGPEQYIHASNNFSVRFIANHIEYNEPDIFQDFNRLMVMYNRNLVNEQRVLVPPLSKYNFKGVPFISAYDGSNRLLHLVKPDEVEDSFGSALKTLVGYADAQLQEKINAISQYYFGTNTDVTSNVDKRIINAAKTGNFKDLGNLMFPSPDWGFDVL